MGVFSIDNEKHNIRNIIWKAPGCKTGMLIGIREKIIKFGPGQWLHVKHISPVCYTFNNPIPDKMKYNNQ